VLAGINLSSGRRQKRYTRLPEPSLV
jgi:hypothetical protein